MSRLFQELKRRNVFRVAMAYVVIGWLITEVATLLLDVFGAPDWTAKALVLLIALGFVPVLLFSWVYELTPEGIKLESEVDHDSSITRRTGKKLDYVTIAAVAIGVAFVAFTHTERGSTPAPVDTVVENGAPSIAVLPFVNMSSDTEQEYFSDGLSEELLNMLAKIPDLHVASRTSAFSYKGKDIRISDVGRELGVAHVLEGSVRTSGRRMRITAQLIDVERDAHVWSDTWDRMIEDVFAIQDEIAAAVVRELRVHLLGELPHAQETTPEAYGLYLQSLALIHNRTVDSFLRAEELIRNALEIDSGYAPSWSRLGSIYIEGLKIGAFSYEKAYAGARDAAERALELDDREAGAHIVLSEIAIRHGFDVPAARQHMEKALEIAPNSTAALIQAGNVVAVEGDFAACLRYAEKTTQLDPITPVGHIYKGWALSALRRHEEAIASLDKALELRPNASGYHYYKAQDMILLGDYDGAFAELQQETLDGFRHTGLAYLYYSTGEIEKSDAELQALVDMWTDLGPYQIGSVYAWRGENDKAIEWLHKAIDLRDTGIGLMTGDGFLDPVRNDPRFAELYERTGFGSKL